MQFTSGQKRHIGSDVTMETRVSCLQEGRNNLKALLPLGIKDLWISFQLLSLNQKGYSLQQSLLNPESNNLK
jgi:hypothetical protein